MNLTLIYVTLFKYVFLLHIKSSSYISYARPQSFTIVESGNKYGFNLNVLSSRKFVTSARVQFVMGSLRL